MYFFAIFLRLAGVFFDDEDELSFEDEALLRCFSFIFMLSESEESESSSSTKKIKI